jgi:uncharacterized protein YndB with AHSA1/START domain/DNA-binding transcriptional ArsR family regulator
MPRDDTTRMVAVFRALADPTRQRLVDRLHADNGQPLGALCADLGISRQGITQHLAVLEAAGLVTTVRRGREKLHYLNPVPLHEVHERWISRFELLDLDALTGLRRRLEHDTMTDRPKLVYVTYIATTPERLWQALTDPDETMRYWNHRNASGWAKGDGWAHRRADGGDDVVGTILEIDPPRRLAHTWSSPSDAGDPARTSTVTFQIEPVGGIVRLTLVHEDLPADQVDGTTRGWGKVLSSMKTMLETGEPLDVTVL